MKNRCITLTLILLFLITTGVAAQPLTFTGTGINPASGKSLSAQADFEALAGKLVVTLSNTSNDDVVIPSDVLTGVFFSLNGVSPLTPVYAEINPNPTGVNTVVYGNYPTKGMVGGWWAFEALPSGPGGATMGISSAGLGLFGAGNFTGDGSTSHPVKGLDWGLTSMGDKPDTGNGGVDKQPLIMYSVVFTLSGLPYEGTDLVGKITDVSFQYGTGLDEPNIPEGGGGGGGFETVPEPGTFVLFGMGLAGLAVIRRRRNR